jgi:hypothetical protein
MSTVQDNRNGTLNLARICTAILLVLAVGMGYAISPRVEGASDLSTSAEDQGNVELAYLPSDCAVDGLVFSECYLDF